MVPFWPHFSILVNLLRASDFLSASDCREISSMRDHCFDWSRYRTDWRVLIAEICYHIPITRIWVCNITEECNAQIAHLWTNVGPTCHFVGPTCLFSDWSNVIVSSRPSNKIKCVGPTLVLRWPNLCTTMNIARTSLLIMALYIAIRGMAAILTLRREAITHSGTVKQGQIVCSWRSSRRGQIDWQEHVT